jgi:hypothetical protein
MDCTGSISSQSLVYLAFKILDYFDFHPRWYHRNAAAGELVGQYYVVMRYSLLRDAPLLRRCVCRCRHCHIFFLTDPRNRGRRDLTCPFGCRRVHRSSRTKTAGSDMSSYLSMVISLIEGRPVNEVEILMMLKQTVRLRSIARRRRGDFIWSCWKGTLESPEFSSESRRNRSAEFGYVQ